jgi:hypothetical protein
VVAVFQVTLTDSYEYVYVGRMSIYLYTFKKKTFHILVSCVFCIKLTSWKGITVRQRELPLTFQKTEALRAPNPENFLNSEIELISSQSPMLTTLN